MGASQKECIRKRLRKKRTNRYSLFILSRFRYYRKHFRIRTGGNAVTGAVIIIILGSSSLALGVALMSGSVLASTRVIRRDKLAFAGTATDNRVRPVVRMPKAKTPEPAYENPVEPEPLAPIIATPPLSETTPSASSLAITTSPAPRSRRVSLEIAQ